jgi:uncharacterized LabA/DUF88 family protein
MNINDNIKYFILGGRSGTSTMAKLVQLAGMKLWSTAGVTEPPYIQGAILNNIYRPKAIEKALKINQTWEIAKLPEFSLILPILDRLYPKNKFIVMQRPLQERMESHIRMGWHIQISDRLQQNANLRHFIEQVTGEKVNKRMINNDMLYFMALDILTYEFLKDKPEKVLFVRYADFNNQFEAVMENVAAFLGLDYSENIVTWKKLKQVPQQAGAWKSK